jgi:hypothetical protein
MLIIPGVAMMADRQSVIMTMMRRAATDPEVYKTSQQATEDGRREKGQGVHGRTVPYRYC